MKLLIFIILEIVILSSSGFALTIWNDSLNTATVAHDSLWSVLAANTAANTWCVNCPISLGGTTGSGGGGFWLYRSSNVSTTQIFEPFTYSVTINVTGSSVEKEYIQAGNTSDTSCGTAYCVQMGVYPVGAGGYDLLASCIGSVPTAISLFNPLYNSVNQFMIVFNTSNTSFWLNGTMIKSCSRETSLNYSQVKRIYLAKETSGGNTILWDNISLDTFPLIPDQLNISLPLPLNNTNFTNYTVNFNLSMNNTFSANCTLRTNSTNLNQTKIYSSSQNNNVTFDQSYININGSYFYNIICMQGNDTSINESTLSYLFSVDAPLFIALNITANTSIIQGIGLTRYDMNSIPHMIFFFILIFLWLTLIIMEHFLKIQLLSIFQFILGLFIGVILSSVSVILCISFIFLSFGLLLKIWIKG